MNWQDWIVALLIILCFARLLLGIFRFFQGSNKKGDPCSNCITGCKIKDMLEEKKKECRKNPPSGKKSCCK